MEIRVETGAIQDVTSDLIVVNLFRGVDRPGGATGAVDAALDGAISELIQGGDFQGKAEEIAVLYTRGAIPARRVLVAGLGERDRFNVDVLRRVSAAVAREVRRLRVTRYYSIVHGAGVGGLGIEEAVQAIVEGAILGTYDFVEHKTERKDPPPDLETLTLVLFDEGERDAAERGALAGRSVGEAVCMARDLANRPGNYMTPTMLAETAEQMAGEMGLSVEVLGESEMAELGMGALLGVAQGSAEEARFIILEHNARRSELPTFVVVGKGLTFDSGGISIKPGQGMEQMKFDMSGAAATLGILRAVAELELSLHVVGLIPATENLPDGRAYKPGDVLKSMSGLTIEVVNTDAEGRLILADVLHYARRYQPRAVVDMATLTGACVIALGHVAAGLMGNDSDLLAALKSAAERSGEKVWELPLYDEYAEQIESDVADVKNVGGRPAGTITAGHFLKKFAADYPWAHLDIAGTAWADNTKGYQVKGATGYGVRLLVEWLRQAAR
ncbi:MAG TPA: leucyl aminopeptidase [Chloroflexi bacterium]|nr:leucyl aminopeptidase [Chloroflexota bacterium]